MPLFSYISCYKKSTHIFKNLFTTASDSSLIIVGTINVIYMNSKNECLTFITAEAFGLNIRYKNNQIYL